jgi:hypothetical protein
MTDAGTQYYKGKEKLQTNSSHNNFVGKLLPVPAENEGKE